MSDELQRWHVAIEIEPDRSWEKWLIARDGRTAVELALDDCLLKDGELLHMIHVSPPKPVSSRSSVGSEHRTSNSAVAGSSPAGNATHPTTQQKR